MVDSSELTPSVREHTLTTSYGANVLATYIGDSMVHLKIPSNLVSKTIVPGVARGANVEIVVIKNQEAFTNNLHLIGSSWLADVLDTTSHPWLLDLIKDSLLMSTWDIDKI